MLKTGERSYRLVAEWDSFESIAAARPRMIVLLDTFRADLEDLGNGLGVNAFDLVDAGVKRFSVGGSIARAVLGFVRRSARELREHGAVGYAGQQIAQSELNAWFVHAEQHRSGR